MTERGRIMDWNELGEFELIVSEFILVEIPLICNQLYLSFIETNVS